MDMNMEIDAAPLAVLIPIIAELSLIMMSLNILWGIPKKDIVPRLPYLVKSLGFRGLSLSLTPSPKP